LHENNMYLFIHTPSRDHACVFLVVKDVIVAKKIISFKSPRRRNVLKDIDYLFKKMRTIPKRLNGIVVHVGPGQFSFLRTGITIANTFGYVLDIPVAAIELEEVDDNIFFKSGIKKIIRLRVFRPVSPSYGKEPNIS
jgi:tRNA A37 threonylcarbamoyladenosine modification protein TsaB